jgi:hypothetical protein
MVARAHWAVGSVILLAAGVVTLIARQLPFIELSTKTYVISLALAALYLSAGTLVWYGLPFGRVLSRVCTLLYLARPRLGSTLWEIMDSPEYREHFERRGK